jgi:hypothetical protein
MRHATIRPVRDSRVTPDAVRGTPFMLIATALFYACSAIVDPDPGPPPRVCDSGDVNPCRCTDGSTGLQRCVAGSGSFGSCMDANDAVCDSTFIGGAGSGSGRNRN